MCLRVLLGLIVSIIATLMNPLERKHNVLAATPSVTRTKYPLTIHICDTCRSGGTYQNPEKLKSASPVNYRRQNNDG